MMVLITYDVNTEDAGGRKRLRQIAKQCVNYGQRVRTPSLNVWSTPRSASSSSRNCAPSWTKKKTACAFITSATNTRPASSTSAQKPAMPRKAR